MSLKDLFSKKNKSDDGIIVLKKPDPQACGGTYATLDTKAPKEIASEEMILFEAESALSGWRRLSGGSKNGSEPLGFVSAFASPSGEGFFLYLEKSGTFRRHADKIASWAFVKEDIFPSLVKLVREQGRAKSNGLHSTTHGRPENFGGSAEICYADGEVISFSNNQHPVFSTEAGEAIVEVFEDAMRGERIALPDVSGLKEIRFEEIRKNGGFTKAALTINADGTGINAKQSRYDDPTVFESEKPVDKATVDAIKKNIEDTGLFAWGGLPESGYDFISKKKLTFVFENGGELTVTNDRKTPGRIRNGFFNIELEMTTKH